MRSAAVLAALLLAAAPVAGQQAHRVYPSPRLTPGGLQETNADSICAPGWTEAHRYVPAADRRAAWSAYGVPDSLRDGEHWELDHFVPLGLGGASDSTNVWPETRLRSDHWNAWRKDVLEGRLRRLVCGGWMPLDTAVAWVRRDWVEAYGRAEEIESGVP